MGSSVHEFKKGMNDGKAEAQAEAAKPAQAADQSSSKG
jgi:Sec-independent protein translocase protein TatA